MRDWWQPGLTLRAAPLLPLSWLFGAVAALRRALYRNGLFHRERLPVPVLVVGNLTVGGAGKTPLVIGLARALAARGYHPGVISRGYGAAVDMPREVRLDSTPADVGDEPMLIRRVCPVFVGRRRAAAGRALLAAYPQTDLIITDDGLQHYALARDAEIAVFDARGAGNGRLLPAGPLREPLTRKVDAIVVNGDAAAPVAGRSWRMHLAPAGFYPLDDPARADASRDFMVEARMSPEFLPEERPLIAAVAGIGNPARFFSTLRGLGLKIEEHPFPDHHPYTAADLAAIEAPLIVMTEKDAIKCAQFRDPRVWVLAVSAQPDAALVDLLLEKLRGPETA